MRSADFVLVHIWTTNNQYRGRRDGDRMIGGFTTSCTISAYHYWRCELEPRSLRGVLDTTLCDKVCQWPIKTYHHDITEILLKVALNTINQTSQQPIIANITIRSWCKLSFVSFDSSRTSSGVPLRWVVPHSGETRSYSSTPVLWIFNFFLPDSKKIFNK